MRRLALLALLCALPFALARADEKELKAARAALKKNEKILPEADRAAAKDPKQLALAVETVTAIREAENEEAARWLLAYAHEAVHEDVFATIQSECALFTKDEAVKGLVATAKDKKTSWQEHVLAARSLGAIENPKGIEGLVALLDEADANVLDAAIEAAAKRSDKKVVEALLKLLVKVEKLPGMEAWKVRQALTALTGEDNPDHAKWKAWWDRVKATWDGKTKGEAKEASATQEKKGPAKRPSFFGTEVRSNKVLFVVDVSGSMQMADPADGPDDPGLVQKMAEQEPKREQCRMERARRELKSAVESLDPSQRFNILSFSSVFKTWKADLQFATDENRRSALEFVGALAEGGGTYTDDALKRAFEMRDVDTIFLLSDGSPRKKLGNPGKQQMEFDQETIDVCLGIAKRETRFRKVQINTFGLCGLGVFFKKWGPRPPDLSLDPETVKPLRQFMQDLARLTGGEFKPL